MAENSAIEWCDHTFNPWVGCTKVSPACDFCYAESWAKRTGQSGLWQGERRRTSAAYWRKPITWHNRVPEFFRDNDRQQRVFCASLADVFDNQVPEAWRDDLWSLIASTPRMNWLLLTKRPQNIAKMLPVMDSTKPGYRPWNEKWPWQNVWLGTTAENQEEANRRIPILLAMPAAIRFVSLEPLLGPIDLEHIQMSEPDEHTVFRTLNVLTGRRGHGGKFGYTETCDPLQPHLDWVITGGESGPHARPMHPDWVRSIRDQCKAAGVPFFFKQWGNYAPAVGGEPYSPHNVTRADGTAFMVRISKKRAGRLLDGVEHNGMPR